MNFRILLAALLLLAPVCAQEGPQPEGAVATLKLATRVVGVSAIVLDKRGAPVGSLTKGDFTLLEDGKPQTISYFSQDADRPLTMALLVDTSGSQKAFLADETAASRLFFSALLTRPEDRAMLVQFDTDVLRLRAMTHSVDALESALDRLSEDHTALRNPTPTGGTLLYDSICSVADLGLGKEQGRRAMVLLTDGGDNGSRLNLEQAVAHAQRADVVIYSIFYSDEKHEDEGAYGKKVLEILSRTTGGRVFTVTKKMPLAEIYRQIEESMRLQYQLGYHPPDSTPGTYHRIELRTGDKHLTVDARTGYFTRPTQAN